MLRRTALAAAALALALAAPARAQSVLRYAPSSDLATLDAMITTATTVGQHGSMVYDTPVSYTHLTLPTKA